ncbi:hypothetical protein ACOMHN_016808 [Nucella lapillus]
MACAASHNNCINEEDETEPEDSASVVEPRDMLEEQTSDGVPETAQTTPKQSQGDFLLENRASKQYHNLIPQQIISLGHHMAHNPGMDQQHMVDLAHPLDVVLVALEFPPSPP